MKRLMKSSIILLPVILLLEPKLSFYYASYGLSLWFEKLLPTLLPFMIISGIILRMNLLGTTINARYYCVLVGFLCGFPMGAKTAAELVKTNRITPKEGEFLFCFCNVIGPIYFRNFALTVLGVTNIWPYFFGMYGLPLLYGILLRLTLYKELNHKDISAMEADMVTPKNFLSALEESIQSAARGMVMLGGYMILFNVLNIIPHSILHKPLYPVSLLLEISGGLNRFGAENRYISLLALTFGGICCLAQTYSCTKEVNFSIRKYVIHKVILTAVSAVYYRSLLD